MIVVVSKDVDEYDIYFSDLIKNKIVETSEIKRFRFELELMQDELNSDIKVHHYIFIPKKECINIYRMQFNSSNNKTLYDEDDVKIVVK